MRKNYGTVLRPPVQCVIWVGAIWDILATLTLFVLHTHLHHSDSIAVMRRVCPNMNDPTALWMTHSVMFVGTIATVVAATLRIWHVHPLRPGLIDGLLSSGPGVLRH